jgi:hypothetical protein
LKEILNVQKHNRSISEISKNTAAGGGGAIKNNNLFDKKKFIDKNNKTSQDLSLDENI